MDDIDYVFIDPWHTKTRIQYIIQHSNIDIFAPYKHNKEKLMDSLTEYLSVNKHEICFYDPSIPMKNRKDLIIYLGRAPDKLTEGEKNTIAKNAKDIIQFCKSGFDFNKSHFKTIDEVKQECIKIKNHGDIFCVRTAIKLFNVCLEPKDHIKCHLSTKIHNELQLKNIYKNKCIPSLQVKHGKFLIEFDTGPFDKNAKHPFNLKSKK